METGSVFTVTLETSLAAVSPFQFLELLNPRAETKGGRFADTSARLGCADPWALPSELGL